MCFGNTTKLKFGFFKNAGGSKTLSVHVYCTWTFFGFAKEHFSNKIIIPNFTDKGNFRKFSRTWFGRI